MSASAAVDAVLLDAFGTILSLEPPGPRLAAELGLLGIVVSEAAATRAFGLEIAYYLEHHLEGRDAASLDDLRGRCAEVIRAALGLPKETRGEVRTAMLGAIRFTPQPAAPGALAELRAAGVTLVAASNWDCSLPEVLDGAGLGPLLDAVVTSAGVGAAKPDPRLFAAALTRVDILPERAVHVGDSVEHDVAGARAAGLRAVLVWDGDRGAEPPDEVTVVRSLAELPSLLLGEP